MFTALLIALVVVVLVLLVLVLVLIWKVLAPKDMFFTFVDEGTCAIIVRAGKFEKALMQWEGHQFDADWNVIPLPAGARKPWHPFGGLRFYGIYPFVQRYSYIFSWTSLHQDGKEAPHIKEELFAVMLKAFAYVVKLTGAEDSNNIPLDFTLVVTANITNPRKTLFEVQDWLEMLIAQIRPVFRSDIAATRTFAQLKGVSSAQVVGPLQPILDQFRDNYGVNISSIRIGDVTPPKEYQDAATKQYMADQEALRIKTTYKAVRGMKGIWFRTLELLRGR